LVWAFVDVVIGEAQDPEAGGCEALVAAGVVTLGSRALVTGSVDLDDEPLHGPVEVDLEAEELRVDQRVLRAHHGVVRLLCPTLESGAAGGVDGQRFVDDVQVAATVGAVHGITHRRFDEAAEEGGLVHARCQLLGSVLVSEVHEGAMDRRDRDALAGRDVAAVEGSVAMDSNAFEGAKAR
jgi:hypothetical protein